MNLPDADSSQAGTRTWPHAPPHRLAAAGVYFVTTRVLGGHEYFLTPARRSLLRDRLLSLAAHYHWTLEAWAVLSSHYHLVAHSPADEDSAESLRTFLRHLHADTARQVNKEDGTPGRKIWHNYRETHLTFQHSYLARLHYTHANAVHHKLVARASDYEWCSAAKFKTACTPAWVKTIQSFAFDKIAHEDGE